MVHPADGSAAGVQVLAQALLGRFQAVGRCAAVRQTPRAGSPHRESARETRRSCADHRSCAGAARAQSHWPELSGAVGDGSQQGLAARSWPCVLSSSTSSAVKRCSSGSGNAASQRASNSCGRAMENNSERVNRLRRAGQQFASAGARSARSSWPCAGAKPKSASKRGDVHRVAKALPPQLQTQTQSLIGFKRRNKRFCLGHRHLNRGRGRAHPVQHMNQPQVTFCQLGMGDPVFLPSRREAEEERIRR